MAGFTAACAGLALLPGAAQLWAQQPGDPEPAVVTIVDTSVSMREAGMDPQWSALLVTKLLTDLVPGRFAVVRLIDSNRDADQIQPAKTGETIPCPEDPSSRCDLVSPQADLEEVARTRLLGLLQRPGRADAGFKQQLEGHLDRVGQNSFFAPAFRAAQAFLGQQPPASSGRARQLVVWLSDGRAEDTPHTRRAIADLVAGGIDVAPIVFGNGDPGLARAAGLDTRIVHGPAEMMRAFAGVFRRIVGAPYEIDNRVAGESSFEIKPYVDEAWVVVYGDDTLSAAAVQSPGGRIEADYAAERLAGAGAYRVAHVTRPAAGRWQVLAQGGGADVAYAVVQRSALGPLLLAPSRAVGGQTVTLVVGLQATGSSTVLTDPAVLNELSVTAEFEGRTLGLKDDGQGADAQAGDGRFSAETRFHGSGHVRVRLHARGPVLDAVGGGQVEVVGRFSYRGAPVEIDLGTLGVDATACRPLSLPGAEHQGSVPFELLALRRVPAEHALGLRTSAGVLAAGGAALSVPSGSPFEVCLTTGRRAPSSLAQGEAWLELRVARSTASDERVTLKLRWSVQGLSFWQRWGWLILLLAALVTAAWLACGFILPRRFARTLALAFAPERQDLDEQTPQPLKQWRGVGIGFYRDARAFLHLDYRVTGRSDGAVGGLRALANGVLVLPVNGRSLCRETLEGDWDAVPPEGRRARAGDVYRVGERGPFFRIASERGRP
jgi:hypothetical protein